MRKYAKKVKNYSFGIKRIEIFFSSDFKYVSLYFMFSILKIEIV